MSDDRVGKIIDNSSAVLFLFPFVSVGLQLGVRGPEVYEFGLNFISIMLSLASAAVVFLFFRFWIWSAFHIASRIMVLTGCLLYNLSYFVESLAIFYPSTIGHFSNLMTIPGILLFGFTFVRWMKASIYKRVHAEPPCFRKHVA